jgi:hypothetical protein
MRAHLTTATSSNCLIVNLTGWTVQYAADVSAAWATIPLSGSLAAGQYYLIKLGNNGATGAALPTPDASSLLLNINATAGKVALVNSATALTVANPAAATVIDLLGYGASANGFEAAVAPTPSNTSSAFRVGLGCYESDNNGNDFVIATTVLPRNTGSALYPCDGAVLLGQYRMEEAAWPAGTGIVKDSSGNNRHGDIIANTAPNPLTTAPARAGNPGTCGYGNFTTAFTSTGRIAIPNLPTNSTPGAQTTVSFWMNWNGGGTVMPLGWQLYDLWIFAGGMGFNTSGSDVYGVPSAPLTNVWKHVTATFTNGTRTNNSIYIDGVLQPLTVYSGSFIQSAAVVGSTLYVGGWGANDSYKFNGRIDELKIYNGALTQAQVTANYNETHPCGALIGLQKTVAVLCDPVNGTVNPKYIPGAVVQYTVTTSNTGTGPATLSQTIDSVSNLMAFDPNLITGAGAPAACDSTLGTPTSAAGKGFSMNVLGSTRGASYPKYLTTSNADADGAGYNAGSITINYPIALPAEAGYTAGEIRANESVVLKFNAIVQ